MAKKVTKPKSLGERVREMREKQGIQIDALAHKTGYDPEYIKDLEEGKISPPVGTLISISRALAIDSASLLSEGKKKARLEGYVKRTKAYSYENLTPDAEDKHLWAYMITLDPKKEHEMVAYKHEGEEFVFVLEGEVEVRVDEDQFQLATGQSLHFNSARSHNLRNLSDDPSKLLVIVYTP